jgi:hypothetical protein
MSGHRQAALALHGLDAADREAILGELPASDRAVISGLMGELDALGIDTSGLATQPTISPATGPVGRINAAGAMQIFQLMEGEPASLVAQLLAAHDWSWKKQFIELLAPAQRGAVARFDLVAEAPRRQALLLESLAAMLPDMDSPAVPESGGKKMFGIFRKPGWIP